MFYDVDTHSVSGIYCWGKRKTDVDPYTSKWTLGVCVTTTNSIYAHDQTFVGNIRNFNWFVQQYVNCIYFQRKSCRFCGVSRADLQRTGICVVLDFKLWTKLYRGWDPFLCDITTKCTAIENMSGFIDESLDDHLKKVSIIIIINIIGVGSGGGGGGGDGGGGG